MGFVRSDWVGFLFGHGRDDTPSQHGLDLKRSFLLEFGNAFIIWIVLRSFGEKNKNIIDRSR
jgi:hypothetical protein